jgi:hypothetical protein
MAFSIKLFVIISALTLLAGCAAQPRYTWCKYDCTLYDHYKNPAQNDEFIEELKEAVMKSEAAGQVPPGLYAEYGYVLYEKGDSQTAIQYFRKEADKWPESRVFMAKMITNAQKGYKKKEEAAKPDTADAEPRQAESDQTEVKK